MRKILFRGKRIDNGEWVYGDLLHFQDRTTIYYYVNGCRTADDVVPSTVGQYTGVTDSNGKKIFEGDVVEVMRFDHNGGDRQYTCEVEYCDGSYYFVNGGIEFCYPLSYADTESDVEVIGNIFDNPELIGGEQT